MWLKLAIEKKYSHSRALVSISKDWNEWVLHPKANFNSSQLALIIDTPKIPTLVELRKYQNEVYAFGILAKLIVWTFSKLNVQRNANDSQIVSICQMIMKDYYYLKLTEIKYCLQQGLKGVYGKLFGKVDETDISAWFEKFTEERRVYISQKRENESNIEKRNAKEAKVNKLFLSELSISVDRLMVNTSKSPSEAKLNRLKRKIERLEKNAAYYKELIERNDLLGEWETIESFNEETEEKEVYDFEKVCKDNLNAILASLGTLNAEKKRLEQLIEKAKTTVKK